MTDFLRVNLDEYLRNIYGLKEDQIQYFIDVSSEDPTALETKLLTDLLEAEQNVYLDEEVSFLAMENYNISHSELNIVVDAENNELYIEGFMLINLMTYLAYKQKNPEVTNYSSYIRKYDFPAQAVNENLHLLRDWTVEGIKVFSVDYGAK